MSEKGTSSVAVESCYQADDPSDKAGITASEKHRFNEPDKDFFEFLGGAELRACLLFFKFFPAEDNEGDEMHK